MKYRANTGLNFPDPDRPGEELRVEVGEVVPIIPPSWLIEQGHVSPIGEGEPPREEGR